MSYIKHVSKDFQEALDGNNTEDSDSGTVVNMNSVCDVVGDIGFNDIHCLQVFGQKVLYVSLAEKVEYYRLRKINI